MSQSCSLLEDRSDDVGGDRDRSLLTGVCVMVSVDVEVVKLVARLPPGAGYFFCTAPVQGGVRSWCSVDIVFLFALLADGLVTDVLTSVVTVTDCWVGEESSSACLVFWSGKSLLVGVGIEVVGDTAVGAAVFDSMSKTCCLRDGFTVSR